MIYQLKEKIIYSEADAIFFEVEDIIGDIMNVHFNDYSGIEVGAVIYQSEDKDQVFDLKNRLEISRLRTNSHGDGLFYFIEELAYDFLSSNRLARLQELYEEEFHLFLIYKEAQLRIDNESIFIPPEASDELVAEIQKILNLYFYVVEEISSEDLSSNHEIDWGQRLTMLFPSENNLDKKEVGEKEPVLGKDPEEKPTPSTENMEEPKKEELVPKPWWKFW